MTASAATALDPRPAGWFAVGLGRDLPLGGELDGVLAAAPFRLSRTKSGALSFEGSIGAIAEQNGFLLAWHHPRDHAPAWRVPALDETGWLPLRYHHLTARSHPQETYENSIDTAHFPVIHGYTGIEIVQPMQCDGHGLKVGYRIARALPIPFVDWKLAPTFEVRLHGIGCAHNHINVAELGLRVRMFALSTPTEPGQVDIRLGVSIARDNRIPLKRIALPITHRAVMRGIVNDFEQDMAIWENKRYLDRPVLAKDDGPIGKFRQWCRQFYVDGAESSACAST